MSSYRWINVAPAKLHAHSFAWMKMALIPDVRIRSRIHHVVHIRHKKFLAKIRRFDAKNQPCDLVSINNEKTLSKVNKKSVYENENGFIRPWKAHGQVEESDRFEW